MVKKQKHLFVLALSKGPEHPNKNLHYFFKLKKNLKKMEKNGKKWKKKLKTIGEKEEKKMEKKNEKKNGSASNIGSVGRVQSNNFFCFALS